MRNKFIKTLGLITSCLTLCLLLNIATQINTSNTSATKVHIDELAPWG